MKGDDADLWLQANDPNYVSPADKAKVTRATEWDLEALGEIIEQGSHTVRQGGTWTQDSFVGFVGDENTCEIDVVDFTTPDDIVCASEFESHNRRRCVRPKNRKKKWRKNHAKSRWQRMQARKNVT